MHSTYLVFPSLSHFQAWEVNQWLQKCFAGKPTCMLSVHSVTSL